MGGQMRPNTRRLLILDIAVVVCVLGMAFQLRTDWIAFDATHTVDGVRPEADADVRTLSLASPQPGPGSDWTDAAELNPFSVDRTDIPVRASDPAEASGAGRARAADTPVLFGTLLIGDDQIAMLAARGDDRPRELRVGELVDGWRLVEIGRKSVVVEAGGASETVSMNDPTARIDRDRSRTTGTGASRPSRVVAPTPPRPAPAATRAPTATPEPEPTAPDAPAPRPGTRVLQTPFGQVVIEER